MKKAYSLITKMCDGRVLFTSFERKHEQGDPSLAQKPDVVKPESTCACSALFVKKTGTRHGVMTR